MKGFVFTFTFPLWVLLYLWSTDQITGSCLKPPWATQSYSSGSSHPSCPASAAWSLLVDFPISCKHSNRVSSSWSNNRIHNKIANGHVGRKIYREKSWRLQSNQLSSRLTLQPLETCKVLPFLPVIDYWSRKEVTAGGLRDIDRSVTLRRMPNRNEAVT